MRTTRPVFDSRRPTSQNQRPTRQAFQPETNQLYLGAIPEQGRMKKFYLARRDEMNEPSADRMATKRKVGLRLLRISEPSVRDLSSLAMERGLEAR
jgi:hypothetical protein